MHSISFEVVYDIIANYLKAICLFLSTSIIN